MPIRFSQVSRLYDTTENLGVSDHVGGVWSRNPSCDAACRSAKDRKRRPLFRSQELPERVRPRVGKIRFRDCRDVGEFLQPYDANRHVILICVAAGAFWSH